MRAKTCGEGNPRPVERDIVLKSNKERCKTSIDSTAGEYELNGVGVGRLAMGGDEGTDSKESSLDVSRSEGKGPERVERIDAPEGCWSKAGRVLRRACNSRLVSAAAASDCSERRSRARNWSSDGADAAAEEETIRKVGAEIFNSVREGVPDNTWRGGDS